MHRGDRAAAPLLVFMRNALFSTMLVYIRVGKDVGVLMLVGGGLHLPLLVRGRLLVLVGAQVMLWVLVGIELLRVGLLLLVVVVVDLQLVVGG
jgi:hypothetical protein